MRYFIETTITHFLAIAADLNAADLLDNSAGIVSGNSGDIYWIAIPNLADAELIAKRHDPNCMVTRGCDRDYVAEVLAALA